MEDTAEMLAIAEEQLGSINEELDVQTEKYLELQKNLCINRNIIEGSGNILRKARLAASMRNILLTLTLVLMLFLTALGAIEYKYKFKTNR